MSWQAEVFARLRDRQWYKLGDIFEAVEQQIPLHYAMRHAMQPNYGRTEMPLNSVARWRYFICALSIIGVEGDGAGGPRQRKWNDRVRLRYVADRACGDCDGPVIKATWSSHKAVVCLACEARAAAQAIEREQAAQAIAAIAAGPVRPVWEQPPYQPPQPPPQITILHPTRGWWFRARRAFAQYIKLTRLPSWSPTRIWREMERTRDGQEMLTRQGKPPVTKQEYDHWLRNYVQLHPP